MKVHTWIALCSAKVWDKILNQWKEVDDRQGLPQRASETIYMAPLKTTDCEGYGIMIHSAA
jgi:hypothetical protein